MTRAGNRFPAVQAALLLSALLPLRAGCAETPDFQEVYGLVRAHEAGLSEAELNRAAVLGLLHELGSRVEWVGGGTVASMPTGPLLAACTNYAGDIAYLRVNAVQAGLAGALRDAYQTLSATHAPSGLVLDLRFADGADYAAIPPVANLFATRSMRLLDWGAGMASSQTGSNIVTVPVVILVNRETERAAEAMAAVLREIGSTLILGSKTAGRASVMQSFPLKSGGQLRIATSPVRLGDGEVIGPDGVTPDMQVPVSISDERAWLTNEYAVLNTNSVADAGRTSASVPQADSRRLRMSEAELVREHRDGLDRSDGGEEPVDAGEPPPVVVRDPALARALDVLNGLAILRRNQS